MFFKSLKEGQWHVTWTDGFANYGMPIGLIAQQVTSYLGALINFLTNNVILSYNLVVFIGAFLSTVFFYIFLRYYFSSESALLGAFLFHFAPYRIINIYIRGAVPEFFGSVFLPLFLIGLYWIAHKRIAGGFILVSLSSALIILTHPMLVIIYSFLIGPYLLFLCYKNKHAIRLLIITVIACLLGFGLIAYYIIPLNLEVKYFYYGLQKNHAATNQFMTLTNFIDPNWYYFYKGDIFPRGHFIKSGVVETLLFITGIIYVFVSFWKKKRFTIDILLVSLISGIILVALMTENAFFLFTHINFLSNVQHQWRLFSAFIYVPPIILAYMVEKWRSPILFILIIVIICIARFPELYGKNYIIFPQSHYFFTAVNLHGNIMNTVWTGATQDYPIQQNKPAIIEGTGKILSQMVRNDKRVYQIHADTNIRMADYTFYFPGWKVYVDGVESPIQFQDPSYRGVITYNVQSGDHSIVVSFTDTKARLLGNVITVLSLAVLAILVMMRKRIGKLLL